MVKIKIRNPDVVQRRIHWNYFILFEVLHFSIAIIYKALLEMPTIGTRCIVYVTPCPARKKSALCYGCGSHSQWEQPYSIHYKHHFLPETLFCLNSNQIIMCRRPINHQKSTNQPLFRWHDYKLWTFREMCSWHGRNSHSGDSIPLGQKTQITNPNFSINSVYLPIQNYKPVFTSVANKQNIWSDVLLHSMEKNIIQNILLSL